jgi:hypothetical protein
MNADVCEMSRHGSEIGLLFGSTEFLSRRPDIPEEVKMSEKMRKAWSDFAVSLTFYHKVYQQQG